jgi:hypothetical protein
VCVCVCVCVCVSVCVCVCLCVRVCVRVSETTWHGQDQIGSPLMTGIPKTSLLAHLLFVVEQ